MTNIVNIFRIEHPILEAGPCMAYYTLWDKWEARSLSENALRILNRNAKKLFSGTEGRRLYNNTPAALEEPIFKAFFAFNGQAMATFADLPSPKQDDMPEVADNQVFGFTSEAAMYYLIPKDSSFWRNLDVLGFVINQVAVPAAAVTESKSKLQVAYDRTQVVSSVQVEIPSTLAQ